jgi:hypothetical protein
MANYQGDILAERKFTIWGKQYDNLICHVNPNFWNSNKGGK